MVVSEGGIWTVNSNWLLRSMAYVEGYKIGFQSVWHVERVSKLLVKEVDIIICCQGRIHMERKT